MGKIIWSKPFSEGRGRRIKGFLGKAIPVAAILLAVVGFALFISIQATAMHEQAHKQIFRFYGVESRIECEDALGLVCKTTPLGGFGSQSSHDSAYIGHAVNEAVFYNLRPYLTLFTVLFLFQTVCLMKIAFRGRG